MTALHGFFIYILLILVARFTCSGWLVCCVYEEVDGGDKAGLYMIEGIANYSWM